MPGVPRGKIARPETSLYLSPTRRLSINSSNKAVAWAERSENPEPALRVDRLFPDFAPPNPSYWPNPSFNSPNSSAGARIRVWRAPRRGKLKPSSMVSSNTSRSIATPLLTALPLSATTKRGKESYRFHDGAVAAIQRS